MRYIDVTGKTEEEAIRKGLEQLGLERDDVSVEILERARSGFLGIGSSPAKVRVTYELDVAEEPKPEAPKAKPAEKKPEPKPAEKKPEPKAEEKKTEPAAPACDNDDARRIKDFLTGLLEHMDSAAEVKVYEEEKNRYKVILEGQKLGALIGRRGETLDAIQQLTNYVVNSGRDKRLRIRVDGNEIASISGIRDWENFSHIIDTQGSHTVEWRYDKDGSVSDGDESCWMDDVVWTPEGGA